MGLFSDLMGGGSETKIVDPYAGTGVRDLYSQLGNMVKPQLRNSTR